MWLNIFNVANMRIDSMDWFNSKGHGICASIGGETHGALQSNLGSLKE